MKAYIIREALGRMYCHWQDRHQSGRIVPPRRETAHPDDPTAWIDDGSRGYEDLAEAIVNDASPDHGMPLVLNVDFWQAFLVIEDGSMRKIPRNVIDAFVIGWAVCYLNNRAARGDTPADPPMTEGGI